MIYEGVEVTVSVWWGHTGKEATSFDLVLQKRVLHPNDQTIN